MTVRKATDNITDGADSQAAGSRPIQRKVKGPKSTDGRTLVTPGVRVPSVDSEGFSDNGEDIIEEPPNFEELKKIREDAKGPMTEQPKRELAPRPAPRILTKTPENNLVPIEEHSGEYPDGVLQIMTNGTSNGTIVLLNGKKLNVKVILNLNMF